LVIDGNGKRGIFSYYVAEKLQIHCKFKPDLIVGVSAGSAIHPNYFEYHMFRRECLVRGCY
jgi:predicted patatin/cPLA2 family phospholipase